MRSVDRSLNDLFRGTGVVPLQFVNEKRHWHGSTLRFSTSAKMGFVSTPIAGVIDVTDRDLTIDVDLGILEHLIAANKASETIDSRIRALLKWKRPELRGK